MSLMISWLEHSRKPFFSLHRTPCCNAEDTPKEDRSTGAGSEALKMTLAALMFNAGRRGESPTFDEGIPYQNEDPVYKSASRSPVLRSCTPMSFSLSDVDIHEPARPGGRSRYGEGKKRRKKKKPKKVKKKGKKKVPLKRKKEKEEPAKHDWRDIFGSSTFSSDSEPPQPPKKKQKTHAPPRATASGPKSSKTNKKQKGKKRKKGMKRRVRRVKRKSRRNPENIVSYPGGFIVVGEHNPNFYPAGCEGMHVMVDPKLMFGEEWEIAAKKAKKGRRRKQTPVYSYTDQSYTGSPSSTGSVEGFDDPRVPWADPASPSQPSPPEVPRIDPQDRFEVLSSSASDDLVPSDTDHTAVVPVSDVRNISVSPEPEEERTRRYQKRQAEQVRRAQNGPPKKDGEKKKKQEEDEEDSGEKTTKSQNRGKKRKRENQDEDPLDAETQEDPHCLLCYHSATGDETLLSIVTQLKVQLGSAKLSQLFSDAAAQYNWTVAESQRRRLAFSNVDVSALNAHGRASLEIPRSAKLTAGKFLAHFYGIEHHGNPVFPHVIDPVFWAYRNVHEISEQLETQKRKAKILGNNDPKIEKLIRDLRADRTRAIRLFDEERRSRMGGNHIVALVRTNVAPSQAGKANPLAKLSSMYRPGAHR